MSNQRSVVEGMFHPSRFHGEWLEEGDESAVYFAVVSDTSSIHGYANPAEFDALCKLFGLPARGEQR